MDLLRHTTLLHGRDELGSKDWNLAGIQLWLASIQPGGTAPSRTDRLIDFQVPTHPDNFVRWNSCAHYNPGCGQSDLVGQLYIYNFWFWCCLNQRLQQVFLRIWFSHSSHFY